MGVRIGEIQTVDEERIQVRMSTSIDNTHEVTDYSPYGIDSLPEKDAKVALADLGQKSHKVMIGVRRKPDDKKAKPGEARLYSKTGSQVHLDEDDNIIIETADGAIIKVKENGVIELNGNTKSAMNWTDFNTVWTAFMTHYKAHAHIATGFGVPTSTINVPLTPAEEDMSAAENPLVRF